MGACFRSRHCTLHNRMTESIVKSTKSCCPEGSWPGLVVDSQPVGAVTEIDLDSGDKMKVYTTKPAGGCDEAFVLFWAYDIGGLDQGRTKSMCDTFAELCGCEVILPDVYLGDSTDWVDIDGFLKRYPTGVVNPRYLKVFEMAGTRRIGLIGTCWGTLPWMSICADHHRDDFVCCVQYHPSTRACGYEGLDEWELSSKVKVPQFIMAAENDVKEYWPGGKAIQVLEVSAPGSVCLAPLEGTVHGWTVRGDITLPEVKRTAEEAVAKGVEFITKMRAL